MFNALDRDTGNEVFWHQIHVGKVDQSKFIFYDIILANFTKWMQELQNIVKLDCKNILNYLRCERRSEYEVVLITEMMTRGSLKDYLAAFRHPKMSICQAWFRQILNGLETLHVKRITHGHLACEHIYINSNTGELKIGDLSLVKLPEILADRVVFHRPVEDIHRFGLLALEVAFAQLLPPPKLRALMSKYYDAPTLDTEKIQKLVCHIEDPAYRSLIIHCIRAESGVTASNILTNSFFTTIYGKDEVLRAIRNKKSSMVIHTPALHSKPPIQPIIPQKRINITVTCNTLKESQITANIVNVIIRIVSGDITERIAFQYDMSTDTPEGLSKEMRTSLDLPDNYVLAVQSQLSEICNCFPCKHVKIVHEYNEEQHPNTARIDVARESESDRTVRNEDKTGQTTGNENVSFIPGTISPIDCMSSVSISTNNPTTEYCKYVYNKIISSNAPPHSKKESAKKDVLQPDVTYSDVQYTPRSGLDDDTAATTGHKKTKQSGVPDEDLKYLQKLLSGLFDSKAGEEVAEGNDENDAKRAPPSI